MMAFLIALLTFLPSLGPAASECYDNTFCVEFEDSTNEVAIYVRSLVPWDITMEVDMDLKNMRASRDLPATNRIPAEGRTKVMDLRVKDIGRSWSFQFDVRWLPGDYNARHEDSFAYALPYGAGVEYVVGQGFHGTATHHGKYAIDWNMPVGTPIRAARGGVVIELEEGFKRGGLNPELKLRANYVMIKHEDGTIAQYVHLRHMGVAVSLGDKVRTGELIGYSGDTGYSSGPHLHFEVFRITEDLERLTIPVQFSTARRGVIHLEEGHSYKR